MSYIFYLTVIAYFWNSYVCTYEGIWNWKRFQFVFNINKLVGPGRLCSGFFLSALSHCYSVALSICLSVYLSLSFLSVYLSISLSLYPSICSLILVAKLNLTCSWCWCRWPCLWWVWWWRWWWLRDISERFWKIKFQWKLLNVII
jgi:hypothetical protein